MTRLRHALSRTARAEVATWMRGGAALLLDFDGTLAPIADDISRARMSATTGRLLSRIAARRPCAVVSGRALEDLRARVADPAVVAVGNHGLEWPGRAARREDRQRIEAWLVALRSQLDDTPGLLFEDKGLTLSVHVRARSERSLRKLAERVRRIAGGLSGARLIGGRRIVNVLPASAGGKGLAARRLLRTLGCRRALYVGDDATDEEVFALPRRQVLSVRVGFKADTRAEMFLRSRPEVDELLRVIARA